MSLFHPFRERSDGRKVRYAVVGAGWIAQEDFMPGVEHTGNSVMAALVTGDPEKAKELAKKYDIAHVTGYDGYDALLRSGNIDAIYLATPNAQHREPVVKALEAGIHVLCEKPMAPTEEDCQAMIAASEKSGAKLMIAYRLHFEEATIEAIETVRAGTVGEPRIFSSVFTQQVSGENSRRTRKLGRSAARHGAVPDQRRAAALRGRADGGVRLHGEQARAAVHGDGGDDQRPPALSRPAAGALHGQLRGQSRQLLSGRRDRGRPEGDPGYTWQEGLMHQLTVGEKKSEKTYGRSDHFGGETKYFSDCILDDKHPEPDGEEGLADVRVILAIQESLRTGQPQKVAPLTRKQRPTREQIVKLSPVKPGEMVDAKPPEEG